MVIIMVIFIFRMAMKCTVLYICIYLTLFFIFDFWVAEILNYYMLYPLVLIIQKCGLWYSFLDSSLFFYYFVSVVYLFLFFSFLTFLFIFLKIKKVMN